MWRDGVDIHARLGDKDDLVRCGPEEPENGGILTAGLLTVLNRVQLPAIHQATQSKPGILTAYLSVLRSWSSLEPAFLGRLRSWQFQAAQKPAFLRRLWNQNRFFGQSEPRPPFSRQLRLDLLGKQKRKTRLVIRMNKV